MSIFKSLVAKGEVVPVAEVPQEESKTFYLKGHAVGDSRDLRRVLALPRRQKPSKEQMLQWAAEFKAEFGIETDKCHCESKFKRKCCANMLPIQAWLLKEAREFGGILGAVGVGHGKTLCDLLVSMVLKDCKSAVLLIPPNLKRQLLEIDWQFYGQHWKLPNLAGGKWLVPGRPTLHVVAYSELSGAKATDLLKRIAPDTIICDEAHNIGNKKSVRTKRILSAAKDASIKWFFWSGTLTQRGPEDFAHMSNMALGEGSPTPLHEPTVREWAGHLTPSDFRSPPGALLRFGQDARVGYGKHLSETQGVVSSGDASACQASLTISERGLILPDSVKKYHDAVVNEWERPDGDPLIDALSTQRCARQVSCGFYYRWRWPRKEPTPVIERWLDVRKKWRKELREKLKYARPFMDSELLCSNAARRWYKGYVSIDEKGDRHEHPPKTKNGPMPVWASENWQEWEDVKNSAQPETEAIWIDDFMVQDGLKWLAEGSGLFWYEFNGFAKQVLKCTKGNPQFLFVGPGKEGDGRLLSLTGEESVLISQRAHGEGKNLQMFNRNLASTPTGSGKEFEQLLGRTFRQGQKSDTVSFEVYRHTETFKNALERARGLGEYIEETITVAQKLTSVATWTFL